MPRWIPCTLLALIAASLFGGLRTPALSQPEGGAPDGMQQAIEKFKKAITPGPEHERLGKLVGEYDVTIKIWMGGPGSPPMSMTGNTATIEWLMEGRWLSIDHRGKPSTNPMMKLFMPTHSFSLLGYDNFKKKYVATTITNASTAHDRHYGLFTFDQKSLVFYGTIDEPLTDEQEKPVKVAYRFKSDDEFVMEVHDFGIGETRTKVVETVFTRRKP